MIVSAQGLLTSVLPKWLEWQTLYTRATRNQNLYEAYHDWAEWLCIQGNSTLHSASAGVKLLGSHSEQRPVRCAVVASDLWVFNGHFLLLEWQCCSCRQRVRWSHTNFIEAMENTVVCAEVVNKFPAVSQQMCKDVKGHHVIPLVMTLTWVLALSCENVLMLSSRCINTCMHKAYFDVHLSGSITCVVWSAWALLSLPPAAAHHCLPLNCWLHWMSTATLCSCMQLHGHCSGAGKASVWLEKETLEKLVGSEERRGEP